MYVSFVSVEVTNVFVSGGTFDGSTSIIIFVVSVSSVYTVFSASTVVFVNISVNVKASVTVVVESVSVKVGLVFPSIASSEVIVVTVACLSPVIICDGVVTVVDTIFSVETACPSLCTIGLVAVVTIVFFVFVSKAGEVVLCSFPPVGSIYGLLDVVISVYLASVVLNVSLSVFPSPMSVAVVLCVPLDVVCSVSSTGCPVSVIVAGVIVTVCVVVV